MTTDDIPWPEKKDRLFSFCRTPAGFWRGIDTAFIAHGYKLSADIVIRQIEQNLECKCYRDQLVFPVVFLYRHYLELSLKAIVEIGGELLDRPTQPKKSHALDELWEQCKSILIESHPDDPVIDLENVQEQIRQFTEIDSRSTAFRYPENAKADVTKTQIDLENLSAVMEKIGNFLDGCLIGMTEALEHKEDCCNNE